MIDANTLQAIKIVCLTIFGIVVFVVAMRNL